MATMNHDPLATVNAWQAAVNARDAERLIELSASDIELVGPRGSARGGELLRQWLERAGLHLTTRRAWVFDDTVVCAQHGAWSDVETGEPRGEAEVASVFKVAAGRVTLYARYDALEQAFAAAGIEKNDPRINANTDE